MVNDSILSLLSAAEILVTMYKSLELCNLCGGEGSRLDVEVSRVHADPDPGSRTLLTQPRCSLLLTAPRSVAQVRRHRKEPTVDKRCVAGDGAFVLLMCGCEIVLMTRSCFTCICSTMCYSMLGMYTANSLAAESTSTSLCGGGGGGGKRAGR